MIKFIIFGIVTAVFLTGCASQIPGADQYNSATAGSMQRVTLGTVVNMRTVTLNGNKSMVGGLAGAGIGGLAGSQIGSGKGSIIAGILGVVAGGIAGNVIENRIAKSEGVELTIKLDDNQLVSIAQNVDQSHPLKIGDRVKITGGGSHCKVSSI